MIHRMVKLKCVVGQVAKKTASAKSQSGDIRSLDCYDGSVIIASIPAKLGRALNKWALP